MVPEDQAVTEHSRKCTVKMLVIILAFIGGAVLIGVGVQMDSFIDLLIGALLVVMTAWEFSHSRRRV